MKTEKVADKKTQSAEPKEQVKSKGRKPLTPAEKEARIAALKAESKEEKLKRLGQYRMTKTLQSIKLLGNLAAYKPTDTQIDAMMAACADMLQRVEARLRGTKKESTAFTL